MSTLETGEKGRTGDSPRRSKGPREGKKAKASLPRKKHQGSGYRTRPQSRSDRLLSILAPAETITLISHISPDPDSLGSMMGLAHLIQTTLGKKVILTRDGLIGRAENKAMVELLDLNLIPVDQVSWGDRDAVVMVDSQPKTGRHSVDKPIPLAAVIDHHDTPGKIRGITFRDVRKSVGATCTMVVEYLREQNIAIPVLTATGMMYGMETELTGYPRKASDADDEAMQWLFPQADRDLLAKIRNARLPQSHFECLVQALQTSFIYDRLIISWVHEMPQPELAAEVVDFLIRFEEVDWAVCAGVVEDKLILSCRSSGENVRAGELLRKVVGRMGRAGGHDRRAGGSILLESTSANAVDKVTTKLRRRLLRALRIDEQRGQRLVSRKDILQSLQS
ncbi:MAG: DHH family phosphoesterase [Gemmataceae bacterium]|nr:DHH family phosphoesterase [Gemmataceae bacterium]